MGLLEVRDLNAYYGQSHILHGVTVEVAEGEIVCLLGRNGVGRSTALKAIMGVVPRSAPSVSRTRRGAQALEVAHLGIGYVPEDRAIFPTLSVRKICSSA